MQDNHTRKWTVSVRFVQWQMNTRVSDAIKIEPYKIIFGKKPTMGLSFSVPIDLFLKKNNSGITEEELQTPRHSRANSSNTTGVQSVQESDGESQETTQMTGESPKETVKRVEWKATGDWRNDRRKSMAESKR